VPSLENTPIPTQEAATNQNNGGLIAYVAWKYGSEDQTDIYVVNSDGSNQRNITNNPGEYSGLAWSLDGNLIAYAGRSGIYVMNADGSNNHKIGDGYGIGITWSPDGTQIAFADVANSAFQLYIMKADGSNVRRITDSLAFITGVSWSPSGSEIAFSSNVDGDMEIYKINIDGSNQQQLTNNTIDDRQPKWSPDGSKILFTSSPEGPSWLYTMNSDGTDVHQVSDTSAVSPTWSPDGSQIAFTKANDGVIYVINSDGTNPHRITIADENSSNIKEDSPAWQPTGASAMASTVAPTPQPQSADSGAQLKLGTVYTSITTDQNGCGTEVNPFLSAHYGFYVVVDASDIPKDTRLFVRLSHNGQPIEDAEEITVDKDYVGVCVYFHFQPVGKDFDPGDYEGQFFINGEAGPSVKFILHATN